MTTKTNKKVTFAQPAAKRYARVLYELAIPQADIERTREIFCQVPEVYEILVNPVVTAKNKYSIIDQIFPKSICNFLKVTCENQRMGMIQEIFESFDRYCEEQKKVMTATLVCVEEPSKVQAEKMKAFIRDKYHKSEVNLEVEKDPSLLGGFILKAGSDEYDWSIRGRMDRLEQKLTWR